MSKLLTCQTCPSLVIDTAIKTIHTPNKGDMKVCKKCYAEHIEQTATIAIPQSTTAIDGSISVVVPKTTNPEVKNYLQQISHVSDPESVPHPITKKKFTQEQLFAEYLQDEQLKISEIFSEGKELGLAYSELENRIQLLESIVFEAKVRASEGLAKKRKLDADSGKNRWDKERRGEVKGNLSDPRNSPLLSKAQKDKKKDLSKAETNVKNMMDIGTSEEDILTMLTSTGKFKGAEIREAIEKFRKGE